MAIRIAASRITLTITTVTMLTIPIMNVYYSFTLPYSPHGAAVKSTRTTRLHEFWFSAEEKCFICK